MPLISRFFSVILILLIWPLFVVITILIYLEDGSPVFYKQLRFGINQKLFIIYKFRTMKRNTPEVPTHMLNESEKYLLKTGKILRRYSLDEIPNLVNILKGDMVFVGPRPALHNQNDLMDLRSKYGIDKLKPGITGWAQINGRDDLSIEEKVKFEKEYLNKRSLNFDFKIILMTIGKVLFGSNVKH